jgi:ankyrin repeat protein
MRMLAAAGADSTLTPDDGTSAVMSAAGVGQVEGPRGHAAFASPYRSYWDETRALEAVKLLLDLGADINAVNKSRAWSALHGAAHIGADRMVRFLVEQGATIDVQDKNGQTPWSLAAEGARDQLTRIPHKSTADLLLQLGAVPTASK